MRYRLLLLLGLLSVAPFLRAQDTMHITYDMRTLVVRRCVLDTMEAKISNDLMALDVRGNVFSVKTRTYDYVNNTVVEEIRTFDEAGYAVNTNRKIGVVNDAVYGRYNPETNSLSGNNIRYTNVVSSNNVYHNNGKIARIEVQDMERGDYEIVYKYDLVGNVTGHDTIYDGRHHTDYTATFDKYHNVIWLLETTHTDRDNEYTFAYNYITNTRGQVEAVNIECFHIASRRLTTSDISFEYDAKNLLAKEINKINEGEETIITNYTRNAKGDVVKKDVKGDKENYQELIERDSEGSCVKKRVVKDGKVLKEITNEISYGSDSRIS